VKRDSYLQCGFVFIALIIFLCWPGASQVATLRGEEVSAPKEEPVAAPAEEEPTKEAAPKEEPAKEAAAKEEPAEEAPAPLFPVTGEISGDAVNVRSGPGTNYSIVSKLNKGDRVVILSEEFGWVKIEMPSATFSWITADFVKRGEGNQATVTASRVNLRAGSGTDFDILGQVNEGDKIEIVDEVKGWYKIKPPQGTAAWIHKDYVFYRGRPEPEVPVVPADDTPEIFAQAEKLYEAEIKKPVDQWDFSQCLPLYQDVQSRSQSPTLRYRAAGRLRVASMLGEFQVRRQAIAQTDKRLQERLRKIEERRKQAEAQSRARAPEKTYTATGRIEKLTSTFYRDATHKLMQGKIAIYLLASEKLNLDDFLGQEVYIRGKVEETLLPGVLLIRVNEVEPK
jgi:uncharacterized protein YraI